MHMRITSRLTRWARRGTAGAAVASTLLAGCKGILDVNNPNNVGDAALDNPAAASALVIGAEGSVTRGVDDIYAPYAAATDETIWVGSRDAYGELNNGNIGNPANEFSDAASFTVNEGRWLADQAVNRLAAFNTKGQLLDKSLLVRAYINAAIIYTVIGEIYDDFTISDRTKAGPPVGEANMSVMFDSATRYLTRAIPLTGSNASFLATIYGLRARAEHSKAVWNLLKTKGTTPSNPLVNDAGASADADLALSYMTRDFRYIIQTTPTNQGFPNFGFEMNSRVEITPGPDWAILNQSARPKTWVITDPVTGQVDSAAVRNISLVVYAPDPNDVPLVQTSQREMYLIKAEAALANSDIAGFVTQINNIRVGLDGAVPYNGVNPAPVAMLAYERRVNLVFQGRRMNDMYRFGAKGLWIPGSTTASKTGCLFPIGITERQSNPAIPASYTSNCR